MGPDITFNNTLTILSLTRAFEIPVIKGAQAPLSGRLKLDASEEHGADGLGGAKPFYEDRVEEDKEKVTVLDEDAIEIVAQKVIDRYEDGREPLTIVSTGAMTDLALILRKIKDDKPEALSKVRISLMGFGIDIGQHIGERWHVNVTDYAEFNAWLDGQAAQEAFQIVHEHNIPTIIAPLDLTHTTNVRSDYEGEWLMRKATSCRNEVAHFVSQLYKPGGLDTERSKEIFGWPTDKVSRCLHDANAETMLSMPRFYRGIRSAFQVVGSGEREGQMIMDETPTDKPIMTMVYGNFPHIVANWQFNALTYYGEQPSAPA